MGFYDIHVHSTLSIGENSPEEIIEFAKMLGLTGIGIVQYYPGSIEKIPKTDIDVISCIIIKAEDVEELRKNIRKIRNKAEIVMVHGGNYDINRAACESSMVDVLCHPELGRKDSGLDHICVKAAAENNVAIEINFREILENYKKRRVNVISSIKRNVMLCNNYSAPVVITSAAVSKWGMRAGRELASFGYLFGLDLPKAIDSVSTNIEEMITRNREKLANKRWEGVKIVGDENGA